MARRCVCQHTSVAIRGLALEDEVAVTVGIVVVGRLLGVVCTPVVVADLVAETIVADCAFFLRNCYSCACRNTVDPAYAAAVKIQ